MRQPTQDRDMPAFKHLKTAHPEDIALASTILAEIWIFLQPSHPKPTLIFAKQHASASAWLKQNAISIRYDSYKKWNLHIKRSVILHEVLHVLGMHHLGFGLDDLAHILRPQIWGLESEESYRRSLLDDLERRLGHRLLPAQKQQASLRAVPEEGGEIETLLNNAIPKPVRTD